MSINRKLLMFCHDSAGDSSFYPIDADAMIAAAREDGIPVNDKVERVARKMAIAFNDAYERGQKDRSR